MTVREIPRVVCFATQGRGSGDERRIASLLSELDADVVSMSRRGRGRDVLALLRQLRASQADIVVMEGTGTAGGFAVMALRLLDGVPYVVSSGDAVGPFLSAISRPLGIAGLLYERALCRISSGFIGWSPYLVGRALTFGSPRGMTAPNWAPSRAAANRDGVRAQLGIPPEAIVFGIVGSLNWTTRYGYCYGAELVRAALAAGRDDLRVLIVGDGNGRVELERMAGSELDRTILMPGAVPSDQVSDYLAAMDVASLPQSVDGVGAFRYTTKISEYLATGIPIVTGQIPLAYDLDGGWLWRLPGDSPWDPTYITALASLMGRVTRDEITRRRPADAHEELFDRARQVRQVTAFVTDVAARERRRRLG